MSSILKVSEIQDPTNGNTALSINSSGTVSASAMSATGSFLIDDSIPYFHARGIASFQSGGYNGLPSTITSPATYTTVDLNQSNLLNTSNGYMEVPSGQAGFYEFFVNSNSGTADGHRGLYVYHKPSGSSPTLIDNTFTRNDYSGYTISSHRIMNLAAGDLIMWGYHNSYVAFHSSSIYFNCWGRRIK